MKTLLNLLLFIPSLSWGLTFSGGKEVGGNSVIPSNTFQIELTKDPKVAFIHTDEIARAGNKSQKFTLSHNSCGAEEGYDDCVNDAQRTERMPESISHDVGDVVYYGLSIFLPKDFKSIHPAVVSLGQVKLEGLHKPIWITKLRENYFTIVTSWNKTECRLIKTNEMIGNWTDFIIKADYSIKGLENNNYFEVWVNDKRKCLDKKQILTQKALDSKYKDKKNKINLRYGIYQIKLSEWFNKNKTKEPQGLEAYDEGELRGGSEHGEMKTITGSPFNYDWGIKLPTQVIYFDEMRVGSTKEEVDVSLNDEPVD